MFFSEKLGSSKRKRHKWSIFSFDKYLLSTYYVLSLLADAGFMAASRTRLLLSRSLYATGGDNNKSPSM